MPSWITEGISIGTPAGDGAVAPHPAGVVPSGTDGNEGSFGRPGLAVVILPQQATEPSLHTPQVWNAPALTELKSPDINVTAGIRHVYRVKAINAAGVGPQSNYVR